MFSVALITENPVIIAGNIIAIAFIINGEIPNYECIRQYFEGTNVMEVSFKDSINEVITLKVLDILKPLVLDIVSNEKQNNRIKQIYTQVHDLHKVNVLSTVYNYFVK